MSRINGSADRTFPMLVLFAGLIGCLVVDYIRRRRPHKDRKVTLTRGRIIYLAWGAEALRVAALAIALCTLPALAFLHGGIGLGGWIGSVCTLLVFAAALLSIRLHFCWPVIQALHGRRRVPLPENAELENSDAAWFYQDKDWFIRINHHYALLYAPLIDFEIPVQHELKSGVKGGHFYYLRFTGRDGMSWLVLHDLDERIEKWVRAHGGCFFRKPDPKKSHRKKKR